LITDTIDLELL